jgi:hypothetical protein
LQQILLYLRNLQNLFTILVLGYHQSFERKFSDHPLHVAHAMTENLLIR